MNYTLNPYTDEHYDFVYETKKNAYKKYVEECYGQWNEEEQKEIFKKFIETYKNYIFIVNSDGKNIGFYNGADLKDGSYEIGNICIIPEYQNKGIGSKILLDKIEEHSGQNIRIQYFKQNPVEKLYESLGFAKNGETEFHYQMIKLKK